MRSPSGIHVWRWMRSPRVRSFSQIGQVGVDDFPKQQFGAGIDDFEAHVFISKVDSVCNPLRMVQTGRPAMM